MENKEEIIINENVKTVKVKKQKPLTEKTKRETKIKHEKLLFSKEKRP